MKEGCADSATAGVEYPPRGYVSLAEAARWASISKKTLWRYIRQGLPVYQARPRSKVLVRLEDIREFLKRRQAQSVDLGRLVDDVMAKMRG